MMHMIKQIMLCSIFLALCSQAFAQQEEEKALKALIQDTFDHVWSELSKENIPTYHTEDFLLLEHGEVWNNDTIAHYFDKALQRPEQAIRTNSFDFIEIKIDGDMAWIAYWNDAEFKAKDAAAEDKTARKARWLESATAIKTADGWKLEMLHSTRVPID